MVDALRYERVVVDRYRYRGFHGCESWCKLEIIQSKSGLTVVIATEVKDNPGTSITNVCEHLAYWVCLEFEIDIHRFVWIEHYDYTSALDALSPRTYDLVSLSILPAGHDAVFAEPKWRPMRDEDWKALGLEPREPGP